MLIGGIRSARPRPVAGGDSQPGLDPAPRLDLLVGRGPRSASAPSSSSTPASPIVETLRVPLLAAAFGLLLVALWANRGYPGMSLAFIGILSNAVVILVNGGYMPIWEPASRPPA